MKKVIVAGHICLDITPVFPARMVQDIREIMVPGKLVQMDGVDVHTGGAVANTGLAMKKLGADVTLMGKIGKDAFGGIILNSLSRFDADRDMVLAETESTSYSVVLAVPGVDRIFLHNPGTNDAFGSDDIDYEKTGKADMFHFGYPPLMKKMYQNQGRELSEMFQRIKEQGTATSLDLAAVDPQSEASRADWEGILGRTLPYVDFFVPSVEELCFMLDRRRFEEWNRRACGKDLTEIITLEDIRPLAETAVLMGRK